MGRGDGDGVGIGVGFGVGVNVGWGVGRGVGVDVGRGVGAHGYGSQFALLASHISSSYDVAEQVPHDDDNVQSPAQPEPPT